MCLVKTSNAGVIQFYSRYFKKLTVTIMSQKLTAIYIGLMKLKKVKKHVLNGGRMTEQEFQKAIKHLNND